MNEDKKNDNSAIDIEKAINLIDSAKSVVLRNLLEKIKDEESLAAHEVKLLKEFEHELKAKQSGTARRIVKSQKQVAEYLCRSERTISYYKNQGMPVNPDGTYDLDAIDTWIEVRQGKGIGQVPRFG